MFCAFRRNRACKTNKLEKIEQSNSGLKKELEVAQRALCSLVETTDKLLKENTELEIKVETLKREISSLSSKRKSLEEKVTEKQANSKENSLN